MGGRDVIGRNSPNFERCVSMIEHSNHLIN